MKLTVTHKDILLILGIVIAIITSVLTWYYINSETASVITSPVSPKANTSYLQQKLSNTALALLRLARQQF